MPLQRTRLCDGPQFIPDMVVVGIGTEAEVVPDAIVGEFHLGSRGKIPGEECKEAVGAFPHPVKQGDDSRQEASLMAVHPVGKPREVGIEQCHDVLLRGGHSRGHEDFTGDPRVGVACEIDTLQG